MAYELIFSFCPCSPPLYCLFSITGGGIADVLLSIYTRRREQKDSCFVQNVMKTTHFQPTVNFGSLAIYQSLTDKGVALSTRLLMSLLKNHSLQMYNYYHM